jgi:acyl-CoA synthetase (AMP-forming)/AMP-acid ligase II
VLEYIQRNQERLPGQGLYLYKKFVDPPEFASYRDFPDQVAAYADFFRDHGIRPGTRVLFPFETSTEVIFSFLGLMEIGALPLSVKPFLMNTPKDAYQDFLGRVARDFGAACVLQVPSLAAVDVSMAALPLPSAGIRRAGARLRTPAHDELAFVQFSSGSTSFPKGIPVRQDKLRANLAMITRTGDHQPRERVSSWLPLYHDMGLVGGMLACFMAGGDLLLAKPETFLSDAFGWWEHMARERVETTAIPNFAVDYSLKLMQDLEPEELAAIDLSRLRSVYLGSEPINISNLVAFMNLMAPAGLGREVFMPCYGMAEAALLVSSRPLGSGIRVVTSPSGVPAISVGRPMPEFTVRLRHEDGRVCEENELGQIELAGGSLTSSYFDDPLPLGGDDGFYASGDIGFVDDGELFITGRITDRIKVNGQSFFAVDFEQAVERLPFVREGRTAVVQSDGQVVVLTEVDRSAREDVEGSRARIVEHLMRTIGVTVQASDVHFLRSGQLHRTSSGKLQRRAIAKAYELGRLKGLTLGSPARLVGETAIPVGLTSAEARRCASRPPCESGSRRPGPGMPRNYRGRLPAISRIPVAASSHIARTWPRPARRSSCSTSPSAGGSPPESVNSRRATAAPSVRWGSSGQGTTIQPPGTSACAAAWMAWFRSATGTPAAGSQISVSRSDGRKSAMSPTRASTGPAPDGCAVSARSAAFWSGSSVSTDVIGI